MLLTEPIPLRAESSKFGLAATRFEQFEVWQLHEDQWEIIAYFRELGVASAIAKPRANAICVKRAQYDGGKLVEEEVLAEMGALRARE